MKNLIDTIKDGATELKSRATAETPTFWKKIQKIAGGVFIVGTLIAALPVTGLAVPAWIVGVGAYMASTGSAIAGMAQLTKK